MDADGSDPTNLTNNSDLDDFPDWSPGGSHITFIRGRGVSQGNSDIYIMNADGSDQINLTNTYSVSDYLPDWSPVP